MMTTAILENRRIQLTTYPQQQKRNQWFFSFKTPIVNFGFHCPRVSLSGLSVVHKDSREKQLSIQPWKVSSKPCLCNPLVCGVKEDYYYSWTLELSRPCVSTRAIVGSHLIVLPPKISWWIPITSPVSFSVKVTAFSVFRPWMLLSLLFCSPLLVNAGNNDVIYRCKLRTDHFNDFAPKSFNLQVPQDDNIPS